MAALKEKPASPALRSGAKRRPLRPARLPAELSALLFDRLEKAFAADVLRLDFHEYRTLLAFLLPEEYRPSSASPTSAAPPGSPARVALYEQRASSGEPLHRSHDLDPVKNDRLAVEATIRGNGRRLHTVGWVRPPGPRPLPAGLYRDASGKWFELE